MVIRRETNLAEVELTPFSHKYLLKRPRTHEQHVASQASNLSTQEQEERIDNPAVEKRKSRSLLNVTHWIAKS